MSDNWPETKAAWARLKKALKELENYIRERIAVELMIAGLRVLGKRKND